MDHVRRPSVCLSGCNLDMAQIEMAGVIVTISGTGTFQVNLLMLYDS